MKVLVCSLTLIISLLLAACSHVEPMETYNGFQYFDLRDDDADGVVNARDICGETPLTSLIDEQGCSQWTVKTQQKDYVFYFEFDKDAVTPMHQEEITELLGIVKEHPEARVFLVGDTSSEGTDEYNQKLGMRRADSITELLIGYGVPSEIISDFVYTELPGVMKKRERRTIARVVYRDSDSIEKWNIFTRDASREKPKP